MMKSHRLELHWVLVWGTAAAGLAGLPAETVAQQGPGQPGERLGTWMAEARASSFHASIEAGGMVHPVADHAGRNGAWVPHRVPVMPAGPDSAASPGKILVSTLIGATIPVVPVMIYYWYLGPDRVPLGDSAGRLPMYLSSLPTLLTVPFAAGLAGADSLWRALVGTGLGFIMGTSTIETMDGDSFFYLGPSVFAAIMAGVTTLAITIREGK
ncbi:MAG: hypothetical protein OXL34_04335 [Gemmatimonadota bacterium]|nr:hypothetical protein [Gemmatimonadota bacterium]